ncbi:MAG: glycosyltransferase [Deltaproteobacteria bacterium]|jgi:hypothetical protein|nr:glycosyltransferase [Deltaproteobacteria bacterium]
MNERRAPFLPPLPPLSGAPLVILPDSGADLLRRELGFAFNELGFAVRRVNPQALLDSGSPDYLPRLLELRPALFFSVNLQGLLPGGVTIKTLLESGTPTLAWFVDNPWHVLSGMRDPSWKKLTLAVTDASFVGPLEAALAQGGAGQANHPSQAFDARAVSATRNGAALPPARVLHLPLAACPYCLEQSRQYTLKSGAAFMSAPLGEVVFAGRSSFPGKQRFFAGLKLPSELSDTANAPSMLDEARAALERGCRPDFAWWVQKLGLAAEQAAFWPGKKSRLPGLGAAESNRLWRTACLKALLESGPNVPAVSRLNSPADSGLNALVASKPVALSPLTLFGDADWLEDFSNSNCFDLRPAFDYYAHLQPVYANAAFSLNLNSLLLPSGLSQRAFDVWAAGGFCLSDASPGLDIFSSDLILPVCFRTLEELLELRDKFRAEPDKKENLRRAWQDYILTGHTYTHRLRDLPKLLKLS